MIEKPSPDSIPDTPGSYQFFDQDGRVIYVGKAKSLRNRVMSYFASPDALSPKTAQMMSQAVRVEWVQVATEVESLLLEYSLIKTYKPRFNIRLIDDKSYPWLAISLSERWPGVYVTRGKLRRGTRYYGPYTNVKAVRETLSLLIKTYPVRTCSDTKMTRHARMGRPCLLYHIGRCSGPCIAGVDEVEYVGYVKGLMTFLSGDTKPIIKRMEREMKDAAIRMDFETAARIRDGITAIRKTLEEQMIYTGGNDNADVIGIAWDELESSVFVLHVRHGAIVGRRAFVIEVGENDWNEHNVVEKALERLYAIESDYRLTLLDGIGRPREVIVPMLPGDVDMYQDLIRFSGLVHEPAGVKGDEIAPSAVAIKVPQRGRKRALLDRAGENAAHHLAQHKLKRSQDPASMARALEELQRYLELDRAPLRIECYDTSHLQGTNYVASMVVIEDGLPRPSEYRRFRLKEVPSNNDFAAMEEVLRRRLSKLTDLAKGTKSESTKNTKFTYPPHLILLDGGKGQLGVGVRVLEEMGLQNRIAIASLAKRLEEVYLPGRGDPVPIPMGSEALYILQRARDESHRTAISYHRKLRSNSMTDSILDGIKGLGEKRQARLIGEAGGVKRLRSMTRDQLSAFSWLPKDVSERVYDAMHPARRHYQQ